MKAFRKIDINGDGYLSNSELRRVLTTVRDQTSSRLSPGIGDPSFVSCVFLMYLSFILFLTSERREDDRERSTRHHR